MRSEKCDHRKDFTMGAVSEAIHVGVESDKTGFSTQKQMFYLIKKNKITVLRRLAARKRLRTLTFTRFRKTIKSNKLSLLFSNRFSLLKS